VTAVSSVLDVVLAYLKIVGISFGAPVRNELLSRPREGNQCGVIEDECSEPQNSLSEK
jgi:hypothetical protein